MIQFRPTARVVGGVSFGTRWWRTFLVRFDWPLFFMVALLIGCGLLNLYSATHRTPNSGKFDNQLKWMFFGLAGYLVMTRIDYRIWHRVAWSGLVASILALIAVQLFSHSPGAQRWIFVGGFRVQPSELAKIAIIIAVARLIHDGKTGKRRLVEVAPGFVGVFTATVMIAIQPDLGTAIICGLVIASACILSLERLRAFGLMAGAAFAALPVLWNNMHDYQKARVLAFLDPAADPTGAGWHAQQSIYAVGSGRLAGKGFLNATQNHFNFLPEYWTDFPFSVWAEEWGFVGSFLLLGVFAFLILWIVNVALKAPDAFGSVVCLGVGALIFWHVVVNVAMVLGIAPVVGLTLPLISYGGSSVVTILLGLGLVSSVSMRRRGF